MTIERAAVPEPADPHAYLLIYRTATGERASTILRTQSLLDFAAARVVLLKHLDVPPRAAWLLSMYHLVEEMVAHLDALEDRAGRAELERDAYRRRLDAVTVVPARVHDDGHQYVDADDLRQAFAVGQDQLREAARGYRHP